MLKELTLFGEIDRVKVAIDRIKEFDPSKNDHDKCYIVPFSGGKDSLVVHKLMELAGVKFKAIHAPTIEFKETYQYIRNHFKDVKQQKPKRFTDRVKNPKFRGKPKTMFNLIANRKIPPTRVNPYCCSDLKENVGSIGDTVVLGVRREESAGRSTRGIVTYWNGKTCINPIVDWSTEDVWEFIGLYELEYNPLYDMRFDRVGCPGCPKSKNQRKELEMFPEWRNWYLTAFKHMLKNLDTDKCQWKTPEDVMSWWLGECEKERTMEGQLELGCEFM